jgi:hypothetical protein
VPTIIEHRSGQPAVLSGPDDDPERIGFMTFNRAEFGSSLDQVTYSAPVD